MQINRVFSAVDERIQQLGHNITVVNSSADVQFQHLNISLSMHINQVFSAVDERVQQLGRNIDMINSSFGSGLYIMHADVPVPSCADLPPSSPSGYYWVRSIIGTAVRAHCDMTRTCGGITGGWMRVAELDMTNSSHQCPSGLKQRTGSNICTCGIRSGSCSSANYDVGSFQYSRVCGS